MIPIEAMASGTPVITVDHGPMPETVDISTGALYPVGDHDAFARVVNEELSDTAQLEAKGEAGRAKVLGALLRWRAKWVLTSKPTPARRPNKRAIKGRTIGCTCSRCNAGTPPQSAVRPSLLR
ncbi:MAG: hypothetical protein CM15mP128_2620 [Methanobacteriota archaeon]|nr:MAG: hypothetical protein CM15mP128_2620 [Euryarchaeota archaeon]